MALEFIANKDYDRKTSEVCKEIAETGVLKETNFKLRFNKAAALMDILEIDKRKFTELRVICKPEGFTIPTYNKLAIYRRERALSSHIEIVIHRDGYPIGVCIAYSKILTFTTEGLSKQLSIHTTKCPLTIDVADGLDGSGSYKVYNQLQTNIDFSTKDFILFAFKILKITSKNREILWAYDTNSPYVTRPVVLISLKENIDNVQFLMNELINPQTSIIEDSGLDISGGHVNFRIIRSLFDSIMSATLSGAGGASCQLCTANHTQLKDFIKDFNKDFNKTLINLIRDGFPINRFIHDAKNLFNDVSHRRQVLKFFTKPGGVNY